MFPVSVGQLDKLHSGSSLKLLQPDDFAGCFERFAENAGVVRHGHAAHDLKREVDSRMQDGRPRELKSHSALAHVGELAPIVLAEIHQHHIVIEHSPRRAAPLSGFCLVSRNYR